MGCEGDRVSMLNNVRRMCREVAEQAVFVEIDTAAIAGYAARLPPDRLHLPEMDPDIHYLGNGPGTPAHFLPLDAVNFGSGFFPDIFGDPRRSGFRALAAALTDSFSRCGPIPPDRLRDLAAEECRRILPLAPASPAYDELIGLYTRALNDLGAFVCDRFGGEFSRIVEEAGRSAERLVDILTAMPLFNDVASYRGANVPFDKRAQLSAIDLHIAFGGEGPGHFEDLDLLTICADNLVPHVLRLDGILCYRRDLGARIDRGEPLPAGSPEEGGIRACAVHAAELIVAELRRQGETINAMLLDNFLWHRGQEPFYRARPRHRTLCVFY